VNGSLLAPLNDASLFEASACAIGAVGCVQVAPGDLPALRIRPGPDVGKPLPPGFLKQADDQAVAALAAVFHAIHDFGLQRLSFADWSVAAAPCFLGRKGTAALLDKYRRQGPRGVTPLGIPFLSLHAVSASISMALQAHGPNLGVGGGPGAVGEGLLTGLTVLLEEKPPGVWLVLTGWESESVADASAPEARPAVCHAAALALVPVADDRTGLRLRFLPSPIGAGPPDDDKAGAPSSLPALIRFLAGRSGAKHSRRWSCAVHGGDRMELADARAAPKPKGRP
jgi:hypothetical protein